jgi:hypothetical protein
MKALSLLMVVMLAACVAAQPTQLTYSIGQEFVFGMGSSVDARHADSITLQPGGGSIAMMNSTVVYQCTDMDAVSYLFVMNMFDTTVNVGQNSLSNSDEIIFKNKPTAVGSGDNSLGDNMYFQQLKTGEIVKIWYNTGDSPYFVNVKAGAINQFQTRVVPANKQTFTYQETDLIGVHNSDFVGVANSDSSLTVAKSFDQKDFTKFATDPNLSSNDLILNANQGVSVHPAGYIQSTTFSQKVLLVNTPSSAQGQSKRDNNGFNMYMLSNGQMNVNLQQVNNVKGPMRTASSRLNLAMNFTALHANRSFLSDSFHGYSIKAALFKTQNPQPMDVSQELSKIFSGEGGARAFAQMTRVIRYLKVHKSDVAILKNFLKNADVMSTQALRDRLFYLLAALDDSQSLIEFGLSSTDAEIRMHAIVTAATLQAPTSALAGSLYSVAMAAEDNKMKHAALLAYGTVLKKLSGPAAKAGGKALVDMLARTPSYDVQSLATVLAAIKNAGPAIVSPSKIVEKAVRLYRLEPSLRSNIRRLLKEYVSDNSATLDMQLSAIVDGSDFPFNRSYSKDLVIGGRDVNLDLHGELFVGTNFDCNQKYFNYEGLAEVTGDFTLFTKTANVFTAEAIYGADNGVHLADQFSLVFLGQTVIDQPFPQVDCMEHTYNLFHSAPVVSDSYVVWISVIPVVFSASAGVTLNVDWGWSICDSELSALLELIPGATFSAQGDVELDLLIIKAGIELAAEVNTQIHPQAYIHGSECEVGFDVEKTNNPMDAYFESFFQLEDCTLWIFDCHWNNKDTQVWWQWSQPAASSILFNEDWKISL